MLSRRVMELLLVLVPLVVTVVFRRTPLGWLPGIGLVVAGIACLAQSDSGGHGEPAMIGAGWGTAIGMFALLYAAICLVIAGYGNSKRAAAAPPPAPPYMVVVPPAPPAPPYMAPPAPPAWPVEKLPGQD